MRLPILMIPALASLLPAPALAAKSDTQLWGNASATVKLDDRWRLQEEMTARLSDNRNGLYEFESNTLLGYRLNKVVTLWAGYTHNPQYAAGDFTTMEHRAREQVTFDGFAKIGAGKLNGRIRLEQRWREHVDGTGWRLRPYLKYSLPIAGKTALNLSAEPFFNLNTTPFQKRTGLARLRSLITVSTPVTNGATKPGWSKYCRTLSSTSSPARPVSSSARAKSSRYCRHDEYEL